MTLNYNAPIMHQVGEDFKLPLTTINNVCDDRKLTMPTSLWMHGTQRNAKSTLMYSNVEQALPLGNTAISLRESSEHEDYILLRQMSWKED